jgi:MinD-like ATPase involved in chromosome partitioning or flagellar assembly
MNQIFTFYSFKGGVGRSMAVANIAELLFLQGKRVVIIDWDLEAPGIEGYFVEKSDLEQITSKAGLIDVLEAYKKAYPLLQLENEQVSDYIDNVINQSIKELFQTIKNTKGNDLEENVNRLLSDRKNYIFEPSVAKYISAELRKYTTNSGFKLENIRKKLYSVYVRKDGNRKEFVMDQLKKSLPSFLPILQRIRTAPGAGPTKTSGLWLLSAGMRDDSNFAKYVRTVQDFNWADFYESYNGEAYFDWMREELVNFADVVLIDSRTGVTEMGSICVRHLADALVMITAPNPQNIAGIEEMLKSVQSPNIAEARSGRPLDVMVIPSRLDNSEIRDLNYFQSDFKTIIKRFVGEKAASDFWDLGIPYVPYYTYHDELVAGASNTSLIDLKDSRKSGSLEKAYLRLSAYMLKESSDSLPLATAEAMANPFIALRPYYETDTNLFYGRSKEIKKMLDIVLDELFLVITGPSGSGKTSAVNAGVIPALRKIFEDRNEMLSTEVFNVGKIVSEENELSIGEAKEEKSDLRRLIFIDQVEDVFLMTEIQREIFFEKIERILLARKVIIILTVRADYCKEVISRLGNLKAERSVVNLGFLSDVDLKNIVLESVSNANLALEKGLIERILKDVENLPNKLAAIQLILQGLWSVRRSDLLTHVSYDQVVSPSSLAQKVEGAFKSMPPDEIASVMPIITRLVNVSTMTRQTLELQVLDKEVEKQLKPFVAAGLIVINYNEQNNTKVIELAYDLLITQWPKLSDWLNKNIQFTEWRQHLDIDLEKWQRSGKHRQYLLSNSAASEAASKLAKFRHQLMEDEMTFINSSLKRKKRSFLISVAIVGGIGMIIGGYLLFQNNRAKRDLDMFKAALTRLDQMGGQQKKDSICKLKEYYNGYNNSFINAAKDSLRKLCFEIEVATQAVASIIDSNNNRLSALEIQIGHQLKTNNKLLSIDSIERALNEKTELISMESNVYKKIKLQEDSSRLVAHIDAIVNSDPLLFRVNETSNNINNAEHRKDSLIKTDISTFTKTDDVRIATYSNSTWFKEGYFLQFENIKVSLENLLEGSSIEVAICDQVGSDQCRSPIGGKNVIISIDHVYNFSYNNFDYVVRLDKIGKAGKNPFKQAAYITFEKYKK